MTHLGPKPRRRLLPLVAGLGVTSVTLSAAASPSYPGELQKALDLGCVPPCTVCHQTTDGGYGTIRPGSFGEAMMTQGGLVAQDPARLRCALALLSPECAVPPACAEPEQTCAVVDSDGDGVGDIEELRALRDPNSDSDHSFCGPQYGCGARIAPRTSTPRDETVAGLLALLVALGLLRRR